ncbi:MAG: hypothetical protein WA876_02845 [Candidatus Acidiferrales bacterium]
MKRGASVCPNFPAHFSFHILEKSIGPNGAPIRPPMHIRHMNHCDAAVIIAYLRSLRKSSSTQTSPQKFQRV